MDKQCFDKVVKECMAAYGFKHKRLTYYLEKDNLLAMVAVQKSYYSDSYYINYGFRVKDIHEDEAVYALNKDSDVSGRFSYYGPSGEKYDFELAQINDTELKASIDRGIEEIILPVINNGIATFFSLFPKAKCAAKIKLKDYLGF